jgi:hypothetical protein
LILSFASERFRLERIPSTIQERVVLAKRPQPTSDNHTNLPASPRAFGIIRSKSFPAMPKKKNPLLEKYREFFARLKFRLKSFALSEYERYENFPLKEK